MARILICEPHEQVRGLLERMVARLGHEPVAVMVPSAQEITSADLVLLEPAAPLGVTLAQAASVIDRSLPLLCVSVATPPAELEELGVVFAARLIKPFTSEQLSEAIERTLRNRGGLLPPRSLQGDCAA
jgi:DNA-binding NtrC family response regulator